MGRIVITKAEAERMIAICEKAEAKGYKVICVNLGDGKSYHPEALYLIRDKGGIVLTTPDETPLTKHILSVPNGELITVKMITPKP